MYHTQLLVHFRKGENVTFEPGCRNNWHKHPGDVVEIFPNVKHWHGAAADSWFAHLAIDPDTQDT
jgi:quercetin dioxygenase-like cupin family protein